MKPTNLPHMNRQLDLFSEVLHAYAPGEGGALSNQVRIPAEAGHGFQSKLDSDSDGSWTPIPGQAGQPEVIT